MKKVQYRADRKINSTENNGYAAGVRDEQLVTKDLIDTEIPDTDILPQAINETGEEMREVYNEEGFTNRPGL